MGAVQVDVSPVDRHELRPPQTRYDECQEDKAISLRESLAVTPWRRRSCEKTRELLRRQPVSLLHRLAWRGEVEKWVGQSGATADPAEETPEQREAAVVRRRRRLGAFAIGVEVG